MIRRPIEGAGSGAFKPPEVLAAGSRGLGCPVQKLAIGVTDGSFPRADTFDSWYEPRSTRIELLAVKHRVRSRRCQKRRHQLAGNEMASSEESKLKEELDYNAIHVNKSTADFEPVHRPAVTPTHAAEPVWSLLAVLGKPLRPKPKRKKAT
jgi:hypothetical protein